MTDFKLPQARPDVVSVAAGGAAPDLAAIRARVEAVAGRENDERPGRCYGGEKISGGDCPRCRASADQNCPIAISDGADAIKDRIALLAEIDRLEARVGEVEAVDVRYLIAEIRAWDDKAEWLSRENIIDLANRIALRWPEHFRTALDNGEGNG